MAGYKWELCCQVRENRIDFLQQRFPASLPHLRIEMKRAQSQAT
jgi:hypothetical protein